MAQPLPTPTPSTTYSAKYLVLSKLTTDWTKTGHGLKEDPSVDWLTSAMRLALEGFAHYGGDGDSIYLSQYSAPFGPVPTYSLK